MKVMLLPDIQFRLSMFLPFCVKSSDVVLFSVLYVKHRVRSKFTYDELRLIW